MKIGQWRSCFIENSQIITDRTYTIQGQMVHALVNIGFAKISREGKPEIVFKNSLDENTIKGCTLYCSHICFILSVSITIPFSRDLESVTYLTMFFA